MYPEIYEYVIGLMRSFRAILFVITQLIIIFC